MTTKRIYNSWRKWSGGKCPVPGDTLVHVKFRYGGSSEDYTANYYRWANYGVGSDIVEYCVVDERPDLEAAEKLLRDKGYTVTPPSKPLTFENVAPMTEDYWKKHGPLR